MTTYLSNHLEQNIFNQHSLFLFLIKMKELTILPLFKCKILPLESTSLQSPRCTDAFVRMSGGTCSGLSERRRHHQWRD